jgi:hypothetical protein
MLVYLFWHWRFPDVDVDVYQKNLVQFHKVLAAHKPAGFITSVVFRIQGAPWLQTDLEAYADWYLVKDSAALDPLNEMAVSASCRETHDKVAREASNGAGSLYRFRIGENNVAGSRFSVWFSKPAGTTYDDLYKLLQSQTSRPGIGLWGRQMVLGPSPEFCLLSPTAIDLPDKFDGFEIPLELLWSET